MATVCDCGVVGLGNLGTPNCQNIAQVTKRHIFVPYYDSTGVINGIEIATANLDKAWFDANLTNTDASKRWQISPVLENVTDERDDSITESLDSGKELFIQQGTRTFEGVNVGQSPTYLGKLKTLKCNEVGVFEVDKGGNIVGRLSSDGLYLYPIRIDKDTFDPNFIKATDTTTAKVSVKFSYDTLEFDEDLKLISRSDMGYNPLDLTSVIDVDLTDGGTALSTEAISIEATMDYGTALKGKAVEGLVLADFDIKVGAVAHTADSVTETTAGVYVFDFTSDPFISADVVTSTLVSGIKAEAKAPLTQTIP